tara:strand:+ start:104 stop:391 length:288 start_codon:yes stop_codon:yes gene_type:complete
LIAKGYWIETGKINTPEIKTYLEAIEKWLPTVGGKFLIRDFESIQKEGSIGPLAIVISFSSKLAAISAYESLEYQRIIAMRTPFSEIQLSIVEGV